MNQEETNVLQLLTGKSQLPEVSVEELEQLAIDYPFFAAAQLMLSKKMQQAAHPDLQKQLYKTALYFPNEMWLRYLLLETEQQTKIENAPGSTDKEEKTENKTNSQTQPDIAFEDNPSNEVDEAIAVTQPEEEPTEAEDANLITLPAEQVLQQIPAIINIADEPEEAPLDDEELLQQSQPLPIEESNQKIGSLLSEQAEEFHKPVKNNEEAKIEAEPFHTVDYFASQGIKLDAKKEDNTFDKKVHKFTDWLRQMKRINPHPSDLGTDSEDENFVANIAASSNQTKEIVTESMAQVLSKQGKTDKAIEVYQKLGLLYPHKSTYFAAKIQDIKQ